MRRNCSKAVCLLIWQKRVFHLFACYRVHSFLLEVTDHLLLVEEIFHSALQIWCATIGKTPFRPSKMERNKNIRRSAVSLVLSAAALVLHSAPVKEAIGNLLAALRASAAYVSGARRQRLS
jgi:hypothetical protein